MSDAIEYTTIEELRIYALRDVTNPANGHIFQIRKLSILNLWLQGIVVLRKPSAAVAPSIFAEIADDDRERTAALHRAALTRGVVSAKIVEADAGPGEIAIHEMDPADSDFLVTEVLMFSGLLPFRPETSPDERRGEVPAMDETAVGG